MFKKLCISITILFCSFLSGKSQSTYFSNTYSIDNSLSAIGFNAIENDNGYFIVGGYALYNSPSAIGIIQTDFEGNVIFKKNYKDSLYSYFAGGQSSLQKVSSGGYVMYGTKQKLDSTNKNSDLLYRFNDTGGIVWMKQLGDSSAQYDYTGRIVKETLDGGFICIGYDGNDSIPVWMVKTDSAGNKEWEKHPGHPYFCQALDLATCNNGGYIYTGQCWSAGPADDQICVTRVDSVGNIVFHKSFGETLKYDAGYGIIETQDGGYAVCGGYRTTARWYPFVLKLNSNGDSLWMNKITPLSIGNGYNYLHAITELDDGSLVSAGNNVFYDGDSIARDQGLIVKLTTSGSLIWQREYYIANTNTSPSHIFDLRKTSDGGFICAGGSSQPQEMWLLKLDSNGCADTTCALTVSIDDNLEASFGNLEDSFNVYPNPNQGNFTLDYFLDDNGAQVHIIDLTGTIVYNKILTNKKGKLTIDTNLPVGIYLLTIHNENKQLLYTTKMGIVK